MKEEIKRGLNKTKAFIKTIFNKIGNHIGIEETIWILGIWFVFYGISLKSVWLAYVITGVLLLTTVILMLRSVKPARK